MNNLHYVINKSIGDDVQWSQDGLHFEEIIRQEYGDNHCVFSAGIVEGHAIDTLYIKWQKDGDEGAMLLLRPDEMAALAYLAGGVLWSDLLNKHLESKSRQDSIED